MRPIYILVVLVLTSCNSSKKLTKTSSVRDSTKTSSIDSTWFKKQLEQVTNSKQQSKETYYSSTKDTVINNIYYPPQAVVTHTIEYIREDGTHTKLAIDTGNYTKKDSANVSTVDNSLNKDNKTGWPITTWVVLGLVAYVLVKDVVFGGIFSKYKITKR